MYEMTLVKEWISKISFMFEDVDEMTVFLRDCLRYGKGFTVTIEMKEEGEEDDVEII